MATQQEVNELKEKIALSCRILGKQGLCKGALGHVSARIPGEANRILIKAKGPDETGLEFATVRDIITIDEAGKRAVGFKLSEGMEVPAELASRFKFARQKSKLAGTIRGSYFAFKSDYWPLR